MARRSRERLEVVLGTVLGAAGSLRRQLGEVVDLAVPGGASRWALSGRLRNWSVVIAGSQPNHGWAYLGQPEWTRGSESGRPWCSR